jgi:hypothetical protein
MPFGAAGRFEQADAQGAKWRSRGAHADVTVLAEGFAVGGGPELRRFRWNRGMGLDRIRAVEPLPPQSFRLGGPGGKSPPMRQSARLRAANADSSMTVDFYFGTRGFEFDIELAPGAAVGRVRLESLDGELALDESGGVSVGGRRLLARPVAYTVDAGGCHHPVEAAFAVSRGRILDFRVGAHRAGERLVIDPVLTYASYFGGSAEESPLGIRELADGGLLIAGNTTSPDLPQGVSLAGLEDATQQARCFVAKLLPATRRIQFVSYLGGVLRTQCVAMDVDASGRILLAGTSANPLGLAAAATEYPEPDGQSGEFLARISADGHTLEYFTYLRAAGRLVAMKAGPGDTVYMARTDITGSSLYIGLPGVPPGYQSTLAGVLVARYNIALRRFDRQTYFGEEAGLGRQHSPRRLEISPRGEVFLVGDTLLSSLPLASPVQTSPPSGGKSAGFVATFSPDLGSLLFSSYLGGQGGNTQVGFVGFRPDGALWLAGWTEPGAIPQFDSSARPDPAQGLQQRAFVARVMPGAPPAVTGWVNRQPTYVDGLILTDGRMCVVTGGSANMGAIIQQPGSPGSLACLNREETDLETITAVGGNAAVASRSGGVWTLGVQPRGDFGDVVPYELKPAAIQPFRITVGSTDSDDLVIRHVDLQVRRPSLLRPRPIELSDLSHANWNVNLDETVLLTGSDFSAGMYLEVQGVAIPTVIGTTSTASVGQVFPALRGFVSPFAAGSYVGHLVTPASPSAVLSEDFPVLVKRLAPLLQPFLTTANPRVFTLNGPFYTESTLRWNGQAIEMRAGAGGRFEIELPADANGTGELSLTTPPPGGGVQRVGVRIGSSSSSLGGDPAPSVLRFGAQKYQVDSTRKLLYTALSFDRNTWTVSARSLPDGRLVNSVAIPKEQAVNVVDLKLSTDGHFLYMTDDRRRVLRMPAETLQVDLRLEVPYDAEPPNGENELRHSITPIPGASESIVVATPAGHLVVYDRDHRRPYSTAEFPSAGMPVMQTVFVGSDYVYAETRKDVINIKVNPCLIRYPMDSLGLAPPEEICNLAAEWGKRQEMQVVGKTLLLVDGANAIGIDPVRNLQGTFRSFAKDYDLGQNLAAGAMAATLTVNNFPGVYRIGFSRIDTGESIGHYPAQSGLSRLPTVIQFLDDGTMVYFEGDTVVVVPDWRSSAQFYDNGQ